MSNQVFLWSMFVLPWLTLFFMKRDEIRRYMPVGLFATLTTISVHDVGIKNGFWVVKGPVYPFNEMLPLFYGMIPILLIWFIKYTYGRFWFYFIGNAVLDLVFVYYFIDVFFVAQRYLCSCWRQQFRNMVNKSGSCCCNLSLPNVAGRRIGSGV